MHSSVRSLVCSVASWHRGIVGIAIILSPHSRGLLRAALHGLDVSKPPAPFSSVCVPLDSLLDTFGDRRSMGFVGLLPLDSAGQQPHRQLQALANHDGRTNTFTRIASAVLSVVHVLPV